MILIPIFPTLVLALKVSVWGSDVTLESVSGRSMWPACVLLNAAKVPFCLTVTLTKTSVLKWDSLHTRFCWYCGWTFFKPVVSQWSKYLKYKTYIYFNDYECMTAETMASWMVEHDVGVLMQLSNCIIFKLLMLLSELLFFFLWKEGKCNFSEIRLYFLNFIYCNKKIKYEDYENKTMNIQYN